MNFVSGDGPGWTDGFAEMTVPAGSTGQAAAGLILFGCSLVARIVVGDGQRLLGYQLFAEWLPLLTLDFRQELTCENALAASMVTVKSVNAQAGAFSVDLPAGDYQVVVSSFGMVTQTADVTVVTWLVTENVAFNLIP